MTMAINTIIELFIFFYGMIIPDQSEYERYHVFNPPFIYLSIECIFNDQRVFRRMNSIFKELSATQESLRFLSHLHLK